MSELLPISPFCFGFGQSVTQLPCQALEDCLIVILSSGSSPDAFCLNVTGFPLHTEVQSDTSLLVPGRGSRLLSLQIRWLSDAALFIFLQQGKLWLGLLALLCVSFEMNYEIHLQPIYQSDLYLDIKASCLLGFKGSFANIESNR